MGEALAGAAEFFAGSLALLVVFGVAMIVGLIISVLNAMHIGSIPVVGGAIMWAMRLLGQGIDDLLGWLWQHCNPVTLGVATLGQMLNTITGGTSNLFFAMYGAVERTATTGLANAANVAIARATYLYDVTAARITAVQAYAVLYAATLYNDAIRAVNAAEASAKGYTLTQYNALQNDLVIVKASVIATALGLEQTLQGWAVTQLAQLRQFVTQTDAARGATTQGEIGDAVKGVEGLLNPAIAGAAAIGAAAAAAFEAWKAECGDPLCNNLNGFGNVISAIEGLLGPAAILALLAEIASNPTGAVDEVVTIGSDIVTPLWDTISAATGLKAA